MSLVICPECGNEVSSAATSCPNCGKPLAPVLQKSVTVSRSYENKEFPKWVFVPIAILGAILLFFVFMLTQRNNEVADTNVNVRIKSTPIQKTNDVAVKPETREVVVPSNPTSKEIVVTEPASTPSTVTKVQSAPNETVIVPTSAPTKAVVKVSAKVFSKNGTPQPVTKEKFYLLNKDLATILSEAKIDDPDGQGLTNAFALSVVNPNKYREINQKSLAAIRQHIVYSTITDSQGNAEIKDVKPNNYYLFAISTTPNSFAIWDSSITIQVGQNDLMLEPQSMTEVRDSND